MSYVRIAQDGSDIYLIDVATGTVECCGCILPNHGAQPIHATATGYHRLGWYATTRLDDMLTHLGEHRTAGHTVPDWVEQELSDNWPTPEETQ